MAGDLERFLQQAAERLKQKLEQGAPAPKAAPPRPPVRQAERARPVLSSEVVDAEILEAELVDKAQRARGPNPLSNLDTRPALAQHIGQTDERMAGHMQEVFDHDVTGLKQASNALQGPGSNQTNVRSEVTKRSHQVSPLVSMLRSADTLRAAFIASEIFARKF